WLLVVDGEIEIVDGGDPVAAGPGFLAIFDPNERREVRARSDARLLLTLAPWPGDGHPSLHAACGMRALRPTTEPAAAALLRASLVRAARDAEMPVSSPALQASSS